MNAAETQTLANVLTILVGLALPLVTASIAKVTMAPKQRAIINAGLAALVALLGSIIGGVASGHWDLVAWLLTFLETWGAAVLAQFGIYLPAGTYEKLLHGGTRVGGAVAAGVDRVRTW